MASPAEVTRSSRTAAHERRRYARIAVSYRLVIRWLECDDCHEEQSQVEDLSRRGALLVVGRPIPVGEVVFVHGSSADGFETRAEVRRVYIGRDGVPRLGVTFLDTDAPARAFSPPRLS